ncbi:FG-GAP-like repeat-containing protein [Arcobacter sp. LA11]|uniref:FG-GAP-like repeat-containing protein n=1 Tax=Arcobacter sp. LA11 TaxID=1898176 RepID=UPI0009327D5A|nr:FG-GAP-like repeat-containing protein [Arcobacter sp. LA11]
MRLLKILIIVCLFFKVLFASSIVGTTKGKISVNQGNMNFVLPLTLPNGVKNLSPNLSIKYNSSSNNVGKLGLGFKLSGFSSISVCNEYTKKDIANLSRDFNYCLNGQKLITVNPSDTYGGNNVEYKTEINNYTKIISYSQDSKTTNWKLFTKNGLVYEYGLSVNSTKKDKNGDIKLFKRNKIIDILGNEINYIYDASGYIESITYSNNKIDFLYEDNDVSISKYYKGIETIYDKRLKSISIKIDNEEISSYNLFYKINTFNNKLIKIENCLSGECLKPLEFTWEEKNENETSYFDEKSFTTTKNFGTKNDTYEAISGDFNADGLTDIVRYTNNQIYTLFAKEDSTYTQKLFTTTKNYGIKNDTYSILNIDHNGDGLTDIIRYTNNKIYTLLSNGDGTYTEKNVFTTTKNFSEVFTSYYSTSGDYNGDGLIDIIRYTNNEIYTFLSNGDGTYQEILSSSPKDFGVKNDTYFLSIGDYDGNGLSDIIRYTNNEIYLLLSKGNGKFTQKKYTTSTNFGIKNDTYESLIGDFNSDGLTDLIRYTNKKTYILFSKGDGTFVEILFTSSKDFGTKDDTYKSLIGDYNGDGLDDIIRYKNKEVYIFFSKGDGTFNEKNYTTETNFGLKNDTYGSFFGEFTGDGIDDYIRYNTNKIYTIKGLDKRNIITNISNSTDQNTSIVYSDLNDSDIYTPDTNSLYPNIDIKGSSKKIVKSISMIDGISGFNTFSYKYEGLKSNTEYGVLGFRKITRINDTNADTSVSLYNQSFPFIASKNKEEKYVNGIKILEEENTYEIKTFQNINEKIKTLYLKNKYITKYDINGDFLLKVKESQSTPDMYGNVSSTKTNTYDSLDETNLFSKEIIKTFKTANENNWIVNLVSNIKTIYKKPNGLENTKENETSYTYNSKGFLLSEKIIDEDENRELLKEYVYNSSGNIIKQSISGTDVEKRSEHYTYDSLGKNIIKVVNALNHIQTNIYDKQDNLIKVISINGLETTWQYDTLNRKIKENRSDNTNTTWTYSWDDSFEDSLYKISVKTTGAPEVTTFFDAKNRKIRVQRSGFKGDVIFEDTYYDTLGRVSKKSTPHYAYELPNFTYNIYDALNRVTNIKTQGPNGENIEKKFIYDKFLTKEIDAKGNTKQIISNIVGQTIKIIEEENATIEYQYDALGNLISTKDSKNNTIEIRYDNQGNKIYINDPDMGEWIYKYNMFGELISQTDAKAQTTFLKYDFLGRLIKRVEKEGESLFFYDISLNGIGKVSIEKNKDYKKEYFYDELGRKKEIKEYINKKVFSTNYAYSEDGKLKTTIHPNGFIVTNEYNKQGYLSAVKSPINNDINLSYEKLKDDIQNNLDKKTNAFNSLINLNTQIEKYRVKALEYYNLAKKYENIDTQIEEQLLKTASLLIQTAIELKNDAQVYEEDYKYFSKRLDYHLIKLVNFNDEQLYQWLMETFSAKSTEQITQALAKLDEATNSLNSINTQEELSIYKEIVSYYIQESKTIINEAKSNIEIARNYKEKYKNLRDGVDKAYQGIFDNTEHKYYYKILAADEFGRITKAFHGNGLETTKEYNRINGQLQRIKTGYDGNDDIRDIKYTFDVLNNVVSKNDLKQDIFQNFTFDNLNRVTSSSIQSDNLNETVNYTYNSVGNIMSKSDLGNYIYQKAHQVKSAGGIVYNYDENGNVIEKIKDNKTIALTYDSYNKPIKIKDDTNTTEFFYAPNRARYKKILNYDTTFYVGKHYEEENIAQTKLEKNYIYVGDELVAVHIEEDDGTITLPQNRYIHKDALGSVDTITNESGIVIQRLAYDAFGKRIVQGWINDIDKNKPLVKRGYTGHEHIDEFELIHMNGRVYDPTLGRFLSADPNIPHPFISQSFNRYSYVRNNPLKYIDPSGYEDEGGLGAGAQADSQASENDSNRGGGSNSSSNSNNNNNNDDDDTTTSSTTEVTKEGVVAHVSISATFTTRDQSVSDVESPSGMETNVFGNSFNSNGYSSSGDSATKEASSKKGEVNTYVGLQGGLHVAVIGINLSFSRNLQTDKFSFNLTVRVGPGLYAGFGGVAAANAKVTEGLAKDKSKLSTSIGIGADIGIVAAPGFSIGYEPATGKVGAVAARGSYGFGAAFGFDFGFGYEF